MFEWKTLPPSRWDELPPFLTREEWRHLHFSSRIKTALERKTLLPLREQILVNRNPSGMLASACCLTPSGMVFPALAEPDPADADAFDNALRRALGKRDFFSLVGTASRVDRLNRLLNRPPRAINRYRLMTGPEAPSGAVPLASGFILRPASLSDLDGLLPLEIAYQKEEVLLSPGEAEPRFIRHNLGNQLREQLYYLVEREGRIIAKGGTNAMGFGYLQLGGIYTLPEFRGRGLAAALVSALLDRGRDLNHRAALFVKPDNPAAVALYDKLGFENREDFTILYYR